MKRSTTILALLATTAVAVPIALSQPVNQYQLTAAKIATALGFAPASSVLTNTHLYVGNSSNVATDVALSGDATLANTGAITLATVASAGTTGSSSLVPVVTINAKGLVTGITTAAISAPCTANCTLTSTGNQQALILTGGTMTANTTPILDITQTWNGSGVVFSGLRMNVTSTLSGAASKYIDLQLSSVSKFSVSRDGIVAAASAIQAGSDVQTGASSGITFGGTRTYVTSPSDGKLMLQNNAQTTGALIDVTTNNVFKFFGTNGTTLASISAGYTVSTLPTALVGARAYVTDQLTTCAAIGVAPTGGGAVTCPVFYNGSAWVGG